jgi:hypothetical protein
MGRGWAIVMFTVTAFTRFVALGMLALAEYRENMGISELVDQAVHVVYVLGLIWPWCWAAWHRDMPSGMAGMYSVRFLAKGGVILVVVATVISSFLESQRVNLAIFLSPLSSKNGQALYLHLRY